MAGRPIPQALIAKLLANPFSSEWRELEQAAAELTLCTTAQAEAWDAGAATAGSPRALLAVLHARALCDAAPASGRVAKSGPQKTAQHTGEMRIALASARCVRQLNQMVGSSAALGRVRHDTWAASFGRTLLHGLALERLVRGHDVLVVGETGVGKEQVAHAIGSALPGRGTDRPPFAELNAAAVPDTLVESELFGHAKGAFTGANQERIGLVRSADGGCLFLDEVGDLPLSAQAKLLRVIETDRVQPLGTEQVHAVDVRYVAATHHDLRARVAQGAFRADLYQRLAGVVIRVPALRERPEDIATIGEHFLGLATHDASWSLDTQPILRWLHSAEARDYAWPGNARELRNVVGNLLLGLPAGLSGQARSSPSGATPPEAVLTGEAPLAEVERWYVARVVELARGNTALAARLLGVDRTTVARKLKQLGRSGE
jgi:transcriptional regulator with AAA-type ATPase domain